MTNDAVRNLLPNVIYAILYAIYNRETKMISVIDMHVQVGLNNLYVLKYLIQYSTSLTIDLSLSPALCFNKHYIFFTITRFVYS